MEGDFAGVMSLGPGGEGEFAGGAGVGCKQPEAVRVAQNVFQGGAGLAGEAVDGGVGEAVGAQQRGEARGQEGSSASSAAGESPVAMRSAKISRAAWTTLPKERAANEPSGRENGAWLEAVALSGSP